MPHSDLAPDEEAAAPGAIGEYLHVRLGGDLVRIPAASILEVMEAGETTLIPRAPPAVLGLINYRGSPATAVDLARVLGRGTTNRENARFLIVRWRGQLVALVVDDVISLGIAPAGAMPVLQLDPLLHSLF